MDEREAKYSWRSYEDRPKINLSENEIILYKRAPILKKILDMDSLLAEEIFREQRYSDITSFEQSANRLRDGSSYQQALFIMLWKKLVDNGIMPLDSKEEPIDLSLMHIPTFEDTYAFGVQMMQKEPEFFRYLWKFYNEHKTDREDIGNVLNILKMKDPAAFVKAHKNLTEGGFIESPNSLKEVNLTAEQIVFLRECYRSDYNIVCMLDYAGNQMDVNLSTQRKDWIQKHIDEINKLIPQMRHTSRMHEEIYWEASKLMAGLSNTIVLEKPSYPEKRKAMFKRAQKTKATIESKV